MKLIGCRYEGRGSYAWEAFIDGFHDLGYTLTGIDRLDSVRSKYFPDSIRVEVSGIEQKKTSGWTRLGKTRRSKRRCRVVGS